MHRAIEECVGHPATNTEADRGPIPKVRLFDPRAESEEDYPLGFFLYVPSQGEWADDAALPPLKLRLAANADGSLKGLTFGTRNLGDDERAFERLNLEMLKIIGRPDDVIMRELSVSIDADKSLPYQHVIEAIEACFGRLSEQSSRRGIYLKRIGFSGIGEWTAP